MILSGLGKAFPKKHVLVSYPNRIDTSTKTPVAISLPGSKSESNRALIIQHLCPSVRLVGLSEANDTQVLQRILAATIGPWHAEDAGTACRFGLAALATLGRVGVLDGSIRMRERPISPLVDALRLLGAEITYMEREGYLPLKLGGFQYTGLKWIAVDAAISSQYISALMLVAPSLPQGLEIELKGTVSSRPYLELTASLMRKAGADVQVNEASILIKARQYRAASLEIEADWSAAAFIYQAVRVQHNGRGIHINNLRQGTEQGDEVCISLFEQLGVSTYPASKGKPGLVIQADGGWKPGHSLELDFTPYPDLAQAFLSTCVAVGQPFRAKGLHTLYIKETDRVSAILNELGTLGALIESPEHGELSYTGSRIEPWKGAKKLQGYDDHRMFMCLAPLAVFGQVWLDYPWAVRKSFPRYWEVLSQLGFTVSEVVY